MRALFALLFATALALPAAAASADEALDYARVDWPTPVTPRFVTLGDDRFVLSTRSGMQVWDAKANSFSPAPTWPQHTSLQRDWVRVAGGTIVSGGRHDEQDQEISVLTWWNPRSASFSAPLVVAQAAEVIALVPVSADHALACLRASAPDLPYDKRPTSTVLLEVAGGMPRIVATGAAANARLVNVPDSPFQFNPVRCAWEVRNRPALLDGATDIFINFHRLRDGRFLLTNASWKNPQKASRSELMAPLLWDAVKRSWTAIAPAAQSGAHSGTYYNYGVDDGVVSVASSNSEFVEFLDVVSWRWIRSQQKLPATYSLSLAPLSNGDALVFLHEGGRILRLSPARGPEPLRRDAKGAESVPSPAK
ncbi:MAG: hypothetical protein ACJ8GW_05245 [Massilia sp.]